MLGFWEMMDRALTGEFMSESEFDMQRFVPALDEVKKKYKIKCDFNTPVPCEDALADTLFEAGVELYSRVGTYCTDTERIIRFTKDEIQTALINAPNNVYIGEGKQRKVLSSRKPDDETVPWCYLGAVGGPVSDERLFLSIMQAYALIPLVDSITTPTIVKYKGTEVRAYSPYELAVSIRSSKLAREACQRVHKPGLAFMNSIASSVSDTAKIAGSVFDLRPSDGWLIGGASDFKINYQRLNEIAFVLEYGGHISGETSPCLGGFCGGAEGVAIANVAYHLQALMVLRGSYQVTLPFHYQNGSNSMQPLLWVLSASSQAISRNSHFPFFTIPKVLAGPLEPMTFYETAATVSALVASGSHIEALSTHKNSTVDLQTPEGPAFASEVAHAVVGIPRKEINRIVLTLLDEYKDRIENPPRGKSYPEAYDIDAAVPFPATKKIYNEMKKKIKNKFGFKFKY